jgi:hypothetical protein
MPVLPCVSPFNVTSKNVGVVTFVDSYGLVLLKISSVLCCSGEYIFLTVIVRNQSDVDPTGVSAMTDRWW